MNSRVIIRVLVVAVIFAAWGLLSSPLETAPLPGTVFMQTLTVGSTDTEVRALQEFLSTLPDVYPEQMVTGYFGSLTRAAVIRFQTHYGIEPVGIVGPKTRAKLNELIAARTSAGNVEEGATAHTIQTPVTGLKGFASAPSYNLGDLARKIQDKVDTERVQSDASRLTWNDTLAEVARLHSEDQARDNVRITDPSKPCTYPMLRHIGLTDENFSIIDRIVEKTRNFRRAGENIVTFPASERSFYRRTESKASVTCVDIPFEELSKEGTEDERIKEYKDAIAAREQLIAAVPSVEWTRREWQTEEEIAEKAVELWLDSEGHRKNLLNPIFDEAGVGIAWVNHYLIITQVFIDK